MKIDTGLGPDLHQAAERAVAAEAAGYDAVWTAETSRDPFFPLALAAPATENLTLGTSIAVAFARNPMLLANIGNDLQYLSKGRFVLGLGSQIEGRVLNGDLHADHPPVIGGKKATSRAPDSGASKSVSS